MEKINIDALHELSGGDQQFEEAVLKVLKLELPMEKTQYVNFQQKGDLIKAGEMVHKMKNKFAVLGMIKSHQKSTTHEKNLRQGNNNGHQDFLFMIENLQNELKNLK